MSDQITPILLPCAGDPADTVWLPPDSLDGLAVAVRNMDVMASAGTKAQEWGLSPGTVRFAGSFNNLGLLVLIVWVQPGQEPCGLRRVTAQEVLSHEVLGPILQRVHTIQAQG